MRDFTIDISLVFSDGAVAKFAAVVRACPLNDGIYPATQRDDG